MQKEVFEHGYQEEDDMGSEITLEELFEKMRQEEAN